MFAKLVRLGRDAEVKYTRNGDPVASLVSGQRLEIK